MAPKLKGDLGQIAQLAKKTFLDLPGTENFRQILLATNDEVVAAYEQFFRKIAIGRTRLSRTSFKQCLSTFMRGDHIDDFAFKIVKAHQHCYSKSRQLTTGVKLADAVRRVAMCYKQDWKESPESTPASKSGSREVVEIQDDVQTVSSQEKPSSSSHLVEEAQAALKRSKTMWGPLDSPQRATACPGSPLVPVSPTISIGSSAYSPRAHEERQALHCMLPHHPTP
jgi:hypothetical protein